MYSSIKTLKKEKYLVKNTLVIVSGTQRTHCPQREQNAGAIYKSALGRENSPCISLNLSAIRCLNNICISNEFEPTRPEIIKELLGTLC